MENCNLVESIMIGNATFLYKTALSEASFKTNWMGSTKWTYLKKMTPLCFWKFCFSIRTSYEELVWCTNYPNIHIHPFHKGWRYIWRCFLTVIILKFWFRRCLHKISFRAKWNIFSSVWSISYNCIYEIPPKLIAALISLLSYWQKWNFISGDKCHVNTIPKWNHSERNMCACKYFIKTKIVDQKIKQTGNIFHFAGNQN